MRDVAVTYDNRPSSEAVTFQPLRSCLGFARDADGHQTRDTAPSKTGSGAQKMGPVVLPASTGGGPSHVEGSKTASPDDLAAHATAHGTHIHSPRVHGNSSTAGLGNSSSEAEPLAPVSSTEHLQHKSGPSNPDRSPRTDDPAPRPTHFSKLPDSAGRDSEQTERPALGVAVSNSSQGWHSQHPLPQATQARAQAALVRSPCIFALVLPQAVSGWPHSALSFK
jgi:hypothetical protein